MISEGLVVTPVDNAKLGEVTDRVDVGGIHKEFHARGSFPVWAVVICRPSSASAVSLKAMSRSYFEEGSLVGVLTPEPIDRVLDYRAPEGGCWLGAFVEVPLGPRRVLGVVWGEGKGRL